MFPPTDFLNWPMDDEQRILYARNHAQARKIAESIHLIHVTSSNLAQLLLLPPPCLLVTGKVPGRPADNMIKIEDLLGLGRCLYFYAGRAYPKAGGAAIAFNKECENGHTGSATPFDTGGLMPVIVGGLRICRIHTNLRDDQLIDFCNKCKKELDRRGHDYWRDDFGEFLAAYFAQLEDYWLNSPWKADAAGIFLNSANSWRSWTYEIRFNEAHNIVDGAEAWCASDAQWTLYADELENAPPEDVDLLNAFLLKSLNEDVGITNYGGAVEDWVRKEAGLTT